MSSECQQIIMNFSIPPSMEDIEVMAVDVLENLPDELREVVESLVIQVDDIPDEITESDLKLDDVYELLALFKSGGEIEPGVKKTNSTEDDTLILYRRAILDYWCESCDDLARVIRQVMVEEIARSLDISDDDIEDIVQRHYQGML